MKNTLRNLSAIILILLSACSTPSQQEITPTAVFVPTAVTTKTPIETISSAMPTATEILQTPTQTQINEFELKLKPNPIEVNMKFKGVQIKGEIAVDDSNSKNINGVPSEIETAKYFATTIYKTYKGQGYKGSFDEFMNLWASGGVSIPMTVNFLDDGNGYIPNNKVDLLPMSSETDVEGKQAFEKMVIVFVNKDLTGYTTPFAKNDEAGYGPNLDRETKTLYIYLDREGNSAVLLHFLYRYMSIYKGEKTFTPTGSLTPEFDNFIDSLKFK